MVPVPNPKGQRISPEALRVLRALRGGLGVFFQALARHSRAYERPRIFRSSAFMAMRMGFQSAPKEGV
jgi:hypothetical protein